MNILITSAGQRVSLVRAFQSELKHFYPEAKVFTTDLCPELSAACNVSDQYFSVSKVTDPAYIDELIDLCNKNDIRMIVPTIDTELLVLASNKSRFQQLNIHVIISSSSFVEQCRDKRKINLFFQQRGINIPKAIEKDNPQFPLFIKPYDGSLSADNYIIHSRKDLREHHLTNEKFLFMEYIDKKDHDEYTVDMYYDKEGSVKCIVPRKRILVRAGEINKGITSKNKIVPYLKEKLGYIEGAVGCLTVQVFLNNITGNIIAIEINPRFGGGYPLSYRAGANYPAWLIQEYFNNQTISYTDDWEDETLMLRYDDEVIIYGNKSKSQ
ncbi:MAG TPA: ATP-grasp domain-containing protein [Chitinophagaceae bacterium]|jgi:carbamoyl-phosphate synthase large subunit|nr:ATP-grasp domain-containing protein [Chitinophagaceae bacterium]